MIELSIFVLVIIGVLATRKLWRKYIESQEAEALVWFERQANDRQERIVSVQKDRDVIIAKHGKWLTIEDIVSK